IVLGFIEPSCITYDRQDGLCYRDVVAFQCMKANAVVAVSQENLRLLRRLFELPDSVGQVVYNGRPAEYFVTPDELVRNRLRQEYGIPEDGVVCFTSGRLEPVKGYQYQIEAMRQLKECAVWDKLYFAWAGVGIEDLPQSNEQALKAAVEEIGATEKVMFLGQRWDVPAWLDASDIFVLTSEAEGMPLSVLEGMAKGLPVVASAVSGVPEALGDTGQLLSNPKQNLRVMVDELVQTIEDWASSESTRRSVGKQCRNRAKMLFRQEIMLEQYATVVMAVLNRDAQISREARMSALNAEERFTPQNIWEIESRFYYASWLWTGWARFVQRDFAGMDEALEQALRLPCAPKGWPILEWGQWFYRFCAETGIAFESEYLMRSAVWQRFVKTGSKTSSRLPGEISS
ncbi:MAG: glycosyltransferase family 4 protein, partial [Phormidesmis sp.]